MRHYKQRWDPNADLVYLKRLRLGDNPRKPFVLPGEPVTQEQRDKLGLARLKRWFDNKTIGLADYEAPEPQRELAIRERVNAEELLDDPELAEAIEEMLEPQLHSDPED